MSQSHIPVRDFLQTATLTWQLLSLRPAGLCFSGSLLWSPSRLLHLAGMFVAELVQETPFLNT